MKQKKFSILYIVQAGVIAAVYMALSYMSAVLNLAFGPIQFRFSEALTILSVFTPAAIPGLAIGCFISNFTSPYGIVDVLVGTTATLLAGVFTRMLRDIKIKKIPFLAPLPPVLINALFVGLSITLLTQDVFSWAFFFATALSVGAGQIVMCYGLGIPVYFALSKPELHHRLFPKDVKRISTL